MEDRCLESKKQSQVAEDVSVKSSSSFSSKCDGEQEKVIKSDEGAKVDVQKHTPQGSLEDDVEESEVEEEDVKVCDICGDAGREDLLAVCSRCSDGAEHTYCMREMLDKVPEGDWICEECKFNEELEAQKQEHSKMLGTSERSKSMGRTGSINYDLSHKLDNKDSSCDLNKAKHVTLTKQVPCKRPGDSIETGPASKKQALESSMISPKMSSPGRIGVLPKDSSFKNLDKTKRKSANQISSGTESTSDSSENVLSPSTSCLHAIKGNFLKSNSFSSANSKPNIKVPDEGFQKQKQGVDAKDGQGKLIGKSMSFKGLGRSNVSEPKVKMLSPKGTPVEELKCQKQARDRISFERKSAIKLDHSFVGPTAANTAKRSFRGDNISTSSVSNNGDHKNAQTDGKLPIMSKHAFHSVHKSSDSVAGSAEVKRQLSMSVCGSTSVNGTSSSSEVKPTHLSIKESSTVSLSRTADRSCLGANGVKADSVESQSEKSLDNSFGRSKQSVGAPLVTGNRRGLSSDVSGSRAKEGMQEENKLKAAIEAAMQKRQDIFKKHRIPEKSIELSMSNTQGNRVGDAVSNQAKEAASEEAIHEEDVVLRDHVPGSCNHVSTSCVKQLKVYPADFAISSVEELATISSAIPAQESVWQGAFEIHRNGRLADMCGGFQAHLSSFASEKVLEVAKKFPHKLVLDEVTRPSAWPVQFKDVGAHEDDIALYFFAKDIESYIRSYKVWLDYMMKHDLALRGDINGVELLVFPSNQLPDKLQRWNNLFFMWGVFRGRKSHVFDRRSGSLESPEMSTSNLIPVEKDASAANPSENPCLHKLRVEDLPVSDSGLTVSGCEASVSVANGDFYYQQHRVGRASVSPQAPPENSQKAANDHSQVSVAEEWSQSDKCAWKDQACCYEDDNIVIEQQHLVQGIGRSNHFHGAKKLASVGLLDKQDMSSHTSTVPSVGEKEGGSLSICNHTDQMKCEDILNQQYGRADNIKNNALQVKPESDRKLDGKEIECSEKNKTGKLKLEGGRKQEGYVDINISAESNVEDFSEVHAAEPTFACQKRPWMDRKDSSKCEDQTITSKRTDGEFNGCDSYRLPSSFGDRLADQMCGASTSSHVEDTSNKVDNEKSTSLNPGSSQRYFFIVDSRLTQSTQLEDDSTSWKVDSLENEDRVLDGSPNLELALGVEKKQSRKGILPFFAGIVNKSDPDGPPDIAISKEDEDASAALSLSLAFPFSDKERTARIERPPTNVEQVLPGRREVNAPLLLFRGSSGWNS